MDEKRPATAPERSDHKLKPESKTGDSGAPKTQALEPEKSVTKMHKLGGAAHLKPLLGDWEKGTLGIDIKSDSSTMMISGTASPIGSRHSLENLGKGRKGLALQGDRMQTSKHKIGQEPMRGVGTQGVDDIVAKLSDYAIQAQRDGAVGGGLAQRDGAVGGGLGLQDDEMDRDEDEEGMQRIAASKEKLQRFMQTKASSGIRSKDSPDSSLHSLQSKSKGILVMGTQLMEGAEADDLPPDAFVPRGSEVPVSSDQKKTKKQYGSQESDTQPEKRIVSTGDQTKAIKGATTSGTIDPSLDDKRPRQVMEEDSSKWKTFKKETDLSKEFDKEKKSQIAPSGKGDGGGQMETRKGEKDGLSDWKPMTAGGGGGGAGGGGGFGAGAGADTASNRDTKSEELPSAAKATKDAKSRESKGSKGSKGRDSATKGRDSATKGRDSATKGSRRSGSKESGATKQGPDANKQGKGKSRGKKESKEEGEDQRRRGRQKERKSTIPLTPVAEDEKDRGKQESSSGIKLRVRKEEKKEEALPVPALKTRPSEPTELDEKAASRLAARHVSPRERKWKEFLQPEKPEEAPEPPAPPAPPRIEEPPVVAPAPKVEQLEAAPEVPVPEQLPPEELDDEEPLDEAPPDEAPPVEPIAFQPPEREEVQPSAGLSTKLLTPIYKEHHLEFTRPFVFSYFRTKPCHYNPENQRPLQPDTMDRAQARLLYQWRNAPDKLRDEGERRGALELHTLDERVRTMQTSPDHIKTRLELLTRLLSRA